MSEVALELYRLLQEIYLMLDDSDRQVLRQFDLTNRQYHALQHLPPGVRRNLTQMSELLLCDKSNVTGLVERMVRDGLVERERSEEDRRSLELSITREGAALRARAREAHDDSVLRRFSILDEEEREQLAQLLGRLYEGLRQQVHDM